MFWLHFFARQKVSVNDQNAQQKPHAPAKPNNQPPAKPPIKYSHGQPNVQAVQVKKPQPKPVTPPPKVLDLGGMMKNSTAVVNIDLVKQICAFMNNVYEMLTNFFKDREKTKLEINKLIESFLKDSKNMFLNHQRDGRMNIDISKTLYEEQDVVVIQQALNNFGKKLGEFLESNIHTVPQAITIENSEIVDLKARLINLENKTKNSKTEGETNINIATPVVENKQQITQIQKLEQIAAEQARQILDLQKLIISMKNENQNNLKISLREINDTITILKAEVKLLSEKGNLPDRHTTDRLSNIEKRFIDIENIVTGLSSTIDDSFIIKLKTEIQSLFEIIYQLQKTIVGLQNSPLNGDGGRAI